MIGVSQEAGLWVVTLRRPEKANSLTKAMLEELVALTDAAGQDEAKALILTGEGRVFSAGADGHSEPIAHADDLQGQRDIDKHENSRINRNDEGNHASPLICYSAAWA